MPSPPDRERSVKHHRIETRIGEPATCIRDVMESGAQRERRAQASQELNAAPRLSGEIEVCTTIRWNLLIECYKAELQVKKRLRAASRPEVELESNRSQPGTANGRSVQGPTSGRALPLLTLRPGMREKDQGNDVGRIP